MTSNLISSQESDNIVDQLPSAVLLFNGKKLLYTNPAAESFTLYTNDELEVKIKTLDLFHPDFRNSVQNRINDFLSGDISNDFFELKIVDKEKKERWLYCLIKTVTINNESALLLNLIDVTDKMCNANDVSRYIEEIILSRDIIEQNAEELAQLNLLLMKSESELKKLNAEKDRFLSIITHDLRSPFSAILGFSEVLYDELEHLTQEEIKAFAKNINQSAQNVINLLNSLLEWYTVNSGALDYKPDVHNLNDVIEYAINLNLANLNRKKISYQTKLPESAYAFFDKRMITSVVQNLISNAIKFTEKCGLITISVKIESDYLTIQIQDSGIGIEKSRAENLFTGKTKESTVGTENEIGSGLGLTICKDLVEKNFGRIWVESYPGKGSSFYFTVPVRKV